MSKYTPRNEQGDHRILKDDPQAIALLKDEHHKFRELFDKAEDAEGEALVKIARELTLRLAIHMTIEEELLYPAVKDLGEEEKGEVDEGIVEHGSGKVLCAEIEQLDGTEELFKSKVHVLGEETVHHIDEEDEELFETAKQAARDGKVDLDELGRKMRARQAELYRQVEETGEMGVTHEAEVEEVPSV
ncbi:hemerythrin domain-containing protein [Sphingomonas oryzagri]|uniref:Hemerythrin domain-containing protein n=1 Tax=Sphingomonas oryzagri TaxID=3042314 RepID=A0ABT6N3J0_9SPHN|nr:hemerythrin domain-containing protein [Sphingomonas oryzagri]MDH7639647.1 hemerythrin domain-containing protein [Sphingomonas oryzagri]